MGEEEFELERTHLSRGLGIRVSAHVDCGLILRDLTHRFHALAAMQEVVRNTLQSAGRGKLMLTAGPVCAREFSTVLSRFCFNEASDRMLCPMIHRLGGR